MMREQHPDPAGQPMEPVLVRGQHVWVGHCGEGCSDSSCIEFGRDVGWYAAVPQPGQVTLGGLGACQRSDMSESRSAGCIAIHAPEASRSRADSPWWSGWI